MMRWAVRGLMLIAGAVLVLGLLPWEETPMVVPAVSPYVALSAAIARRALTWVTLLGVPVLLVVLVRRRWFCRCACPVGLLTECAGRLSPMPKSTYRRLPNLGPWITLTTLAAACLGVSLFLWLDPLAIFAGFFSVFHRPWTAAVLVPALGLPAVVVLSFLIPGAWCLRVCPLGALQELVLVRASPARKTEPKDASIELGAATAVEEGTKDSRPLFNRRTVVAMGLGAVWPIAAPRVWPRRKSTPIRPPGSVAETQFSSLCIRCGNCVRACPAGIVQADLGQQGLASFLTPVVRFENDYCRETCHRCTQVCPSGALARLSLEAKRRATMGVAQVDMSVCVLADDRECQICRNHCPYEAIQIVWSEESYTNAPRVDTSKCPGCGACEAACITTPQKAIRVVPCGTSTIQAGQ